MRKPDQLRLQLGSTLTPTEADLRAVFDRSHLAMSFGRAMSLPATGRCLVAAAKARLAVQGQTARRRR